MFLFKGLASALGFSQAKGEVIQAGGAFYSFSPIKKTWICLLQESKITIRKAEEWRSFVEISAVVSEEDVKDEEDDTKQEYSFEIKPSMKLSKEVGPLEHTGFSWTSESDDGKQYLFEFSEEGRMADLFELTILQSTYEHEYKTPGQNASDEDLQNYITHKATSSSSSSTTSSITSSSTISSSSPSIHVAYPTLSPPTPQLNTPAAEVIKEMTERKTASEAKVNEAKAVVPNVIAAPIMTGPTMPITPQKPEGEELTRQKADLYLWEPPLQQFLLREKNIIAAIYRPHADAFLYMVYILKDEKVLFGQKISSDLYASFDHQNSSMIWYYSEKQQVWQFSLLFEQKNATEAFETQFAECLYETNNEEPFSKVPKADRSWITQGLREDVTMEPDDGVVEESDLLELMEEDSFEDSAPPSPQPSTPSKSATSSTTSTPSKSNTSSATSTPVKSPSPSPQKTGFKTPQKAPARRVDDDTEDTNDDEEDDEDDYDEDSEEQEQKQASIYSTPRKGKSTTMFAPKDTDKNSLLTIGYKNNDRAFVARGSQIGVFKNDGEQLEYVSTMTPLKDSKGRFFSPCKTMLHRGEENLLVLNPKETNSVYRMDLNRGEIVDKWVTREDFLVEDIIPEEKYSQLDNTNTFLGMNHQAMFMIDPRKSGDKQVESKSIVFSRATKPQLSAMATTDSGAMCVGGRDGKIRLYGADTLDIAEAKSRTDPERRIKAKTELPGYGDPIIGLDVTNDGCWILGTCKTYLLLIPTELASGKTGFEARMGQDKPAPRRLQLRREDVLALGGPDAISFTPAKFSTGEGLEKSIVTSTGEYLITWSFRQVKMNKLQSYSIAKYGQKIVSDQFRFGDDKSIVACMPDDVSLIKRVVKPSSRNSIKPPNSP